MVHIEEYKTVRYGTLYTLRGSEIFRGEDGRWQFRYGNAFNGGSHTGEPVVEDLPHTDVTVSVKWCGNCWRVLSMRFGNDESSTSYQDDYAAHYTTAEAAVRSMTGGFKARVIYYGCCFNQRAFLTPEAAMAAKWGD